MTLSAEDQALYEQIEAEKRAAVVREAKQAKADKEESERLIKNTERRAREDRHYYETVQKNPGLIYGNTGAPPAPPPVPPQVAVPPGQPLPPGYAPPWNLQAQQYYGDQTGNGRVHMQHLSGQNVAPPQNANIWYAADQAQANVVESFNHDVAQKVMAAIQALRDEQEARHGQIKDDINKLQNGHHQPMPGPPGRHDRHNDHDDYDPDGDYYSDTSFTDDDDEYYRRGPGNSHRDDSNLNGKDRNNSKQRSSSSESEDPSKQKPTPATQHQGGTTEKNDPRGDNSQSQRPDGNPGSGDGEHPGSHDGKHGQKAPLVDEDARALGITQKDADRMEREAESHNNYHAWKSRLGQKKKMTTSTIIIMLLAGVMGAASGFGISELARVSKGGPTSQFEGLNLFKDDWRKRTILLLILCVLSLTWVLFLLLAYFVAVKHDNPNPKFFQLKSSGPGIFFLVFTIIVLGYDACITVLALTLLANNAMGPDSKKGASDQPGTEGVVEWHALMVVVTVSGLLAYGFAAFTIIRLHGIRAEVTKPADSESRGGSHGDPPPPAEPPRNPPGF